MKKYTPAQLLRLLGIPAATVLLGLVLLFSPDTASALAGKLLAWFCILAALGQGVGVFLGAPARKHNRILWAVICFAAGVWLLMNPLTVAKFLGRVLGIVLISLGVAQGWDKLRGRNLLEEGSDPNIIDVEKL